MAAASVPPPQQSQPVGAVQWRTLGMWFAGLAVSLFGIGFSSWAFLLSDVKDTVEREFEQARRERREILIDIEAIKGRLAIMSQAQDSDTRQLLRHIDRPAHDGAADRISQLQGELGRARDAIDGLADEHDQTREWLRRGSARWDNYMQRFDNHISGTHNTEEKNR